VEFWVDSFRKFKTEHPHLFKSNEVKKSLDENEKKKNDSNENEIKELKGDPVTKDSVGHRCEVLFEGIFIDIFLDKRR
jgi:hypothetical protein